MFKTASFSLKNYLYAKPFSHYDNFTIAAEIAKSQIIL